MTIDTTTNPTTTSHNAETTHHRRKSRSSSCGSYTSDKTLSSPGASCDAIRTSDCDGGVIQLADSEICSYYDITSTDRHQQQAPNIITVANHYCNVVDSDVEQYFLTNLSRNTSVCQSQMDIASYGSYTSLSLVGAAASTVPTGTSSSTRRSPANSSCSIHQAHSIHQQQQQQQYHSHHHHHSHHSHQSSRRSSIVSKTNKCPHHRRRKHSTSCSTLQGSIKASQSNCSYYHGSSTSIYEPTTTATNSTRSTPPPQPPPSTMTPLSGRHRMGSGSGISSGGCCDESSVSIVLTPSKVTIEHHNTGTDGADSIAKSTAHDNPHYIELPDYACSPSPIKWNFISNTNGELNKNDSIQVASTSSDSSSSESQKQNRRAPNNSISIWQTRGEADEANAIIFHHESGMVENCCDNYPYNYCNYATDESENVCTSQTELNQYAGKGINDNNNQNDDSKPKLNNMTDIRSQPSTSIDILNRNNITSVINQLNLSPEFRQYEKFTNLNHNSHNLTPHRFPNSTNYNSSFWFDQNTDNNVNGTRKFINTSRNSMSMATNDSNQSEQFNLPADTNSDPYELFNISSNRNNNSGPVADKTYGINLTTQNHFDTSTLSHRRHHHHEQPHTSFYNDDGNHQDDIFDQSHDFRSQFVPVNSSDHHRRQSPLSTAVSSGSYQPPLPVSLSTTPSSSVVSRFQNVTSTVGLSGLIKIVRKRAKKCADYLSGER